MAGEILWVMEAPTIATALARSLTEELGGPVRPFPLAAEAPPPGPALVGIRGPDVWGMTRAAVWKRRSAFPIAGMAIAPTPLEAWVAGEIDLDGLVDLREPWPLFLQRVKALLRGEPAWTPELWGIRQAFEQAWGERLRRLSVKDWSRWRDLMSGLPIKGLARWWGLSRQGAMKAALRLYRRLGVPDREAAALLAQQLCVVRISETGVQWTEAVEAYLGKKGMGLLGTDGVPAQTHSIPSLCSPSNFREWSSLRLKQPADRH